MVEQLLVGEPYVVLWVKNLLDRVWARPIEVPLSVLDAPRPAAPLEVAQEDALLVVDSPADAKIFGASSFPRGGPIGRARAAAHGAFRRTQYQINSVKALKGTELSAFFSQCGGEKEKKKSAPQAP
eukprot:scaffold977_cov38-Phaeocystis_antarctica.AAC.4